MSLKRPNKGESGYINTYKHYFGSISLMWIALIVVVYIVGFLIFKTQKNLLTVVAVLAVLPAARKWIAWIVMIPYKSVSQDKYQEIKQVMAGRQGKLYADHVITKYEGAMYLPLVLNYNDNLFVYAPAQKKSRPEIAGYLNDLLRQAGSTSKAQVYETYEKYLEQCHKLADGPDLTGSHQTAIEEQLFIVTI